MSIVYRIYSNGGSGGPIDYSSPIATVSSLVYTTRPLSFPGDYRFGVHAFDTSTGLEELNTQASVCITLDASGKDIGQGPNAPYALVARPTASGGCVASWAYQTRGKTVQPTSFFVYLTVGPLPILTAPIAKVVYKTGVSSFRCQFKGLVDQVIYNVAVVAQGIPGSATSTVVSTTVIGDSTPPADVDALAGTAIP